MATVTKKFCDRCGTEMRYVGWTARLKIKRIGIIATVQKLLNGNPDGFSYVEWDYELCADCTKKLERFLNGRELLE